MSRIQSKGAGGVWADTPLGRHPREDPFPRSACWNTVHKRAVPTPLECILVNIKTHSLLCLFPGRHVVFSGWIMSKLDYVFIHCATEVTSLYPLWFHRPNRAVTDMFRSWKNSMSKYIERSQIPRPWSENVGRVLATTMPWARVGYGEGFQTPTKYGEIDVWGCITCYETNVHKKSWLKITRWCLFQERYNRHIQACGQ